ncbi:MAG: hypothetical protein PHV25_00005, partial [Candidatus Pacebacteria bacterium]|nr:hypothetical protein [Candidatus Paceibacterota bacterium]
MEKLNYNRILFLLSIMVFSFAFFANGTQAYAASGSISCSSVTSNSVKLKYDYASPDSQVEIRRGGALVAILASGTRSGYYTNTGLSPNTKYTYYLRTTSGQTLDTATCSTSGGTSPIPTNPSGSISCGSTSNSSIQLNYNYSNTTSNVEIWNGQSRIATLLSGTRSGSYTNTGLSQNTTYTYYLRHSGQTLDTATCSTSGGTSPIPTNPSGSISCGSTSNSSIQLNYNYSNTTSNVEIWNGQSRIATLLSGTRSGSYTNTGLSNNTTYTYYLRHSGQTLD